MEVWLDKTNIHCDTIDTLRPAKSQQTSFSIKTTNTSSYIFYPFEMSKKYYKDLFGPLVDKASWYETLL